MATPRKPIPKSQRKLSIEKQDAFKGIDDRGAVGNPNSADEIAEFSKLNGHQLIHLAEESGDFTLFLRKTPQTESR